MAGKGLTKAGGGPAGEPRRGLSPCVAPAGDGAWTVRVAVTPGGAKDALAGMAEDRLRVRLRAKAVEGRANAALTIFLASCLGLRPRQVRIVSGEKSRKKTVRIEAESEPDWASMADSGCD